MRVFPPPFKNPRSSAALSQAQHGSYGAVRRYWLLLVLTLVYALNIADRFAISTLIEPIKAEFHLSDGAVGFLTGVSLAIFYVAAGLPLGRLADRANRRNMIVGALVGWSFMTGLCGLTRTFLQLLLARIGVGIGEAGGTPPSHSMIADYFAPAQRLVAMSIYSLGVPAGLALGAIGAGWFADHFGWRSGLLAFSACGLPVALLMLTLREPRRGLNDEAPRLAADDTSLAHALGFIWRQKSLMHVLIGATIATFSGGGLVWWTPAFLARSHGFTVGQAGFQVGLMGGAGGALATLASIALMARLARLDAKWQCYFLAILTAAISIPAILAHMVAGREATLLLLWCFVPLANVYVGPTLALIQNLTASAARGLTVAILLFAANVANLVFAPQLIGWASDWLAMRIAHPSDSLRFALIISATTGFWAAAHFVAAVRTLKPDLQRAGAL
jgi:MFS family permease